MLNLYKVIASLVVIYKGENKMTKQQKFILSVFALTLSFAMMLFSVNNASAFSEEARQNFEQLKQLKKEHVREQFDVARSAAQEVRVQQRIKTKGFVKDKAQERINQARAEFSEKHRWGNGEIKEQVKTRRDELAQQACERSKTRYQKRLEFYKNIESKYISRYKNAVSKVDGTLNKLEALGFNVDNAREKFNTWITKIDEVVASLRENGAELEKLASVDCSDPQAALDQVKAIRARFQETRVKAKEARDYYREELRPTLIEFRNERANQ